MKSFLLPLFVCCAGIAYSQSNPPSEHVFIVMTDGFRWQEVFSGADSAMINDDGLVMDKELARQMYWDSTADLRRKKLMPFFWNVIAKKGRLYGNRALDNMVSMQNVFKISYPGYNEILTGYADPVLIPNVPLNNRNTNVLEFLNRRSRFTGKVVVFGSWNVFPFIVNAKRSDIPVNSGYQANDDPSDSTFMIIDRLQKEVSNKSNTRHDLLTFCSAKEYISKNHPSVVFIGFGETDESAHAGRYDLYLQHASEVDHMIAELWYRIQTDPIYKDHTTLIITTDHGRGQAAASWHKHGIFTKGSGQTWLACIGAGVTGTGEMKEEGQIYGRQIAATIGQLLGVQFQTGRPMGKAIQLATTQFDIELDKKSDMVGRVK